MPRFLSRMPYGARTNPVDAFNFEADTVKAIGDLMYVGIGFEMRLKPA